MTTENPAQALPATRQNQNGGALNLRAPLQNIATLKNLLERAKTQIAEVLPKHFTAERMMKLALMAANKQPKLLNCSMETVLQSIMQAASIGLEVGGVLGQAWLVPYGNECKLIPGYRGYITLARNSGEISSIAAEVVYAHDKFVYRKGLNPVLDHDPDIYAEQNPKDIIGAYMVAHLKDGGTHVEFMNRQQIEKIRKGSKMGGSGPWIDYYDEMCRKTVVRRGCKYLPISSEKMARALELDNESDDSLNETISVESSGGSKTSALLAKVISRPVSEGQTLEATPEALQEAAQGGAPIAFPGRMGTVTVDPAPKLQTCRQFAEAMGLEKAAAMGIPMTDEPFAEFIARRDAAKPTHTAPVTPEVVKAAEKAMDAGDSKGTAPVAGDSGQAGETAKASVMSHEALMDAMGSLAQAANVPEPVMRQWIKFNVQGDLAKIAAKRRPDVLAAWTKAVNEMKSAPVALEAP